MSERAAVVTGAARGIGRATVARLGEDGYRVVALDRDEEGLSAAWGTVPGVVPFAGDATAPQTIQAALDAAGELGEVHAFVANAGTSSPGSSISYERADWDGLIEVHLTAAFEGARRAASRMPPGAGIVCVSSIAALQGFAGRAAYSAAKAGVIGLVRSLAVEWAPHGLRVNAVAPGYVATELVRANVERGFVDEAVLRRRIPLGRLGDPSEIANVVGFLLSDAAAYMTGVTLPVDGGWTAYGLQADPDQS